MPTNVGIVLETIDNLAVPQNQKASNNDFNPLPPINVDRLRKFLINHPDTNLVNFLIDGFCNGFSIGYTGSSTPGQCRNLLSARSNTEAVSSAISKEVTRGNTAGPFYSLPFVSLHCSPLGAVPKKDGSHRIILVLSSPRGSSINEGISADLYSVKYSNFDDSIKLVTTVGKNCFMAKLDIKQAFRLCPVHPSDWHYLGL